MKTFEQLTQEEKMKARAFATQRLVSHLVEGELVFDEETEKGKEMNLAIKKVMSESDSSESVVHSKLMDKIGEDLEPYIQMCSEDIYYLEDNEFSVHLDEL